MQEIMRERKEASQERRRRLMRWLKPLLIVVVLIIATLVGALKWQEHRARIAEEKAQNTPNPMRGITSFGNEEAPFKIELTIPDSIMAPTELMVVVHRAVGIKPFKVHLQVIDLSHREGLEQATNAKTSAKINGTEEAAYLDEQGNRQTVTLADASLTPEILAKAITLAYQETYPDEDPEHPFYIDLPKRKETPDRKKAKETIDLQVDKLKTRN